jgi:hypothetical protein
LFQTLLSISLIPSLEEQAMKEYYENKVAVVTGGWSGNAFHHDRAQAMDEYLLNVARKRRRGETAV